jgi:diguanylate cyclase (GGDEF)-like protein
MTQPEKFLNKVMALYNNPEESSIDILALTDGRYFRRFSQPQRIREKIVGRVWSFSDITDQKRAEEALEESNHKLEILSITDGLTGIANRRHFDAVLAQEYARHARHETKLALIMLDIDHFKTFNDCYGHVAGDECLRRIGQVLAANATRSADLPARYGGEEFVCILPETDSDGAVGIAEKIRQSIQELAMPHERSSVAECVTASLGVVSVMCSVGGSPVDIVAKADELLYVAKSMGRNRVEYER